MIEESCGVLYYFLGVLFFEVDLIVVNFCYMVNFFVESIFSCGKFLIIVGGLNLYVEVLVDDEDYKFRLRYDCCFLWVDVVLFVLNWFVFERVDKMV